MLLNNTSVTAPAATTPELPKNTGNDRGRNARRILNAICVVLLVLLMFLTLGLVLPSFGTMQKSPSTTNIPTPNVGYTIYTPTYIPPGTHKDDITTQNIKNVSQVFQNIIGSNNIAIEATVRKGKYDSASVAYWVCSPNSLETPCSQIGVDKSNNKIYKTANTIGSTFWGVIINGTFVNIEASQGSIYTDQYAIATINSLREVPIANNTPNIAGAYTEYVHISKSNALAGEDIKFDITMKNNGQPYANQMISFSINSGTGPLREPFAKFYVKTDASGHTTVRQVLPWLLLRQHYDFGALPIPIDPTNDEAGSINEYQTPSAGMYLAPLLIAAAGARMVFRKKSDKLTAPKNVSRVETS